MKIELIMRDANGVSGLLVCEGEWIALDVNDIEIVRRFRPNKFSSITLFHDNGDYYRFGPVFFGASDEVNK